MSAGLRPKNIFEIIFKKNYPYLILFLLISTFFIYFIIRPNLKQLIMAKKRLDELSRIKNESDLAINKLITIQSNIERLRNDFSFFDELIFQKPEINNFLFDVESVLVKNNLTLNKLSINDVDLISKNNRETPNFIVVKGEVAGNFIDFYNSIKEIHKQSRLKEFDNFKISRKNQSTDSSRLIIEFELKTNYL